MHSTSTPSSISSPHSGIAAAAAAPRLSAAASTAPSSQLPPSTRSVNILYDVMDNPTGRNEAAATASARTTLSSAQNNNNSSGGGGSKGALHDRAACLETEQGQRLQPAQQQLPPSTTYSCPPLPFITSVDVPAFFASSPTSGATSQLPRRVSYISQNLSNQTHSMNQYTASSTAATGAESPLVRGHSGGSIFSMVAPPAHFSTQRTEEEILHRAVAHHSHRSAASEDARPLPARPAPAHRCASCFSTSLSSTPPSSISPPPEEARRAYVSLHLPDIPILADGDDVDDNDDDDAYDHAMHGQEAFVMELCDGAGDTDKGDGGDMGRLGASANLSHRSLPLSLHRSSSLRVEADGLSGFSAAPGSRAAAEPAVGTRSHSAYGVAAPPTGSARPPPPLSTFQPIHTSESNEHHHQQQSHQLRVASAAAASSAAAPHDTQVPSRVVDDGTPTHSLASSGHRQAPALPSQVVVFLQQQQQQQQQQQCATYSPSPAPSPSWPGVARGVSAEDVAALGCSQRQHQHQYQQLPSHQQLHGSMHSQSSSRRYSVGGGATGAPTASSVVAPALSGSGYYTVSGTPPSGGSAQVYMLVPSSNANSPTGHVAHHQLPIPQQNRYMMPVAGGGGVDVGASASPYGPGHGAGAAPPPPTSSSQQPATPTTVSVGGGASSGAAPASFFLAAAPTAFAGYPPGSAGRPAADGPPPAAAAAPSSYYVYLPTCHSTNTPPSHSVPLQSYATGHFTSPMQHVGIAPEQPSAAAAAASSSSPLSRVAAGAAPPHMVGSADVFAVGGKAGAMAHPGIRPAASTATTDLSRKQVNVHGAMVNVLPYYAYNENAPPAPTAHIVTGAASANASMLAQSLGGSGWSARSANSNAECALDGSGRSLDGGRIMETQEVSPYVFTGDMSALATAPVLPIFIQMFPCELRDRVGVLNRVIEATCGRDAGFVHSFESRSETSFIAHVRTHNVWDLIQKVRCRVLMDRFGFWYAADIDQYVRMKEYCEGVRRLPQQTRHFQTDGLPCMPLVVELSRSVDRALVTENTAPRCFDEIVPIAAVDRHRARLQGPASTQSGGHGSASGNSVAMAASTTSLPAGAAILASAAGDVRSLQAGSPVLLTSEGHMVMMSPPHLLPGLSGGSFRTGSNSGASPHVLYADPQYQHHLSYPKQ
ncbi:hypothetical protein NESM_000326200 [Novymonas esmeraldas]|uniref:Uncharacterized protein n=1 Tax=Novymonas esmeraldas TaxID=1808958 RepID=A0AAW0EK52_9TRYP